jgi:Uma2 family endonuclease
MQLNQTHGLHGLVASSRRLAGDGIIWVPDASRLPGLRVSFEETGPGQCSLKENSVVAQPEQRYVTPEEYLERDRDAEFKSEYDDGVIVAMAGATSAHATITYNFGVAIAAHLDRAGCRGYSPDLRVRIEVANRYYYPDFTASCGQPELQRVKQTESLLNPKIILEVLSSSTERQDRGRKWLAYQTLKSLDAYILAHQDRPCVEAFLFNRGTNTWEWHLAEGLGASLTLPILDCEISLAAIYANIEFGQPTTITV